MKDDKTPTEETPENEKKGKVYNLRENIGQAKKWKILGSIHGGFIHLFFNQEKASSLRIIAAYISVLLTIGSAYLSYFGFLHYIDASLAFILTIGIHILLLFSAWQLSTHSISGQARIKFFSAFIFALLFTVFFSYSELIDNIYSKDKRLVDEIDKAEQLGLEISEPIEDEMQTKISSLHINFKSDVDKINTKIVTNVIDKVHVEFEKLLEKMRENIITEQLVHDEVTNLNLFTVDSAETENEEWYLYFLQEDQRLKKAEQTVSERKYNNISIAAKKYYKSYENLNSSSDSITQINLSQYSHNLTNLIISVNENTNASIRLINYTFPKEYYERVKEIENINKFLVWKERVYDRMSFETIEDSKTTLTSFISHVPTISSGERRDYMAKINEIGKFIGGREHFEFVYGLLFRDFHLLALFSLLLALSIGISILLASLVSRDEDVLLNKTKDFAIKSILQVGDEGESETPVINKMKKILTLLNSSNFNINNLYSNYPIVLLQSDIFRHGLSKEFAAFVSYKLIKVIDKNNFMITESLLNKLSNLLNESDSHIIIKKLKSIENIQFTKKDFSKILQTLELNEIVNLNPQATKLEQMSLDTSDNLLTQANATGGNYTINFKKLLFVITRNPKIGIKPELIHWLTTELEKSKSAESYKMQKQYAIVDSLMN